MIVNFGSLNADMIFEMDEIPLPGQTLLANSMRIEAGGKGANQAVAAARDGALVVMVGAVGCDPLRDVALNNFQTSGVNTSRVVETASPTGCATVIIDASGRNMIAVAQGANLDARSDQIEEALLQPSTIVLLQMENALSEIVTTLRRAHEAGAYTILNLAPAIRLEPEILALCSLIVVNEDEAEALAGWLGCEATASALRLATGADIVRTLGGEGSEAATADEVFHVPALAVTVVDTTAAGDCFIGVLASSLDRSLSLKQAITRATTAAGIACSRRGSQSSLPLRHEIDAA